MNESNRRERERERLEGVEAGAAELYRQRKQAEQGRKSRTEEEEGDKSAVSPSPAVGWLAGWPLMMPSSILPWLLLLILCYSQPSPHLLPC
jgi:hypothetical protein